jgi:hydroxymethylbilane synthase
VSSQALLRIGSRASALARTQAEWVADRIGCCTALVWVKSGGDADRTTKLTSFGGTGIFTAELHKALHADRIDAAVHSLKDLPAGAEPGVTLACVPVREDVRDALVGAEGTTFASLPAGARVGTGSPRRVAQLKRARPDLVYEAVRGNVDTRIRHVREGRLDAVILAVAGLRRLGRDGEISEILDPSLCVPAAGQGALGITIREKDSAAEACLAPLRDVSAAACTTAERAALHALGAGCHTPVGALARFVDGRLRLEVRLLDLDGTRCLEAEGEAGVAEAAALGTRVAEDLRGQGADALLESGA